MNASIVNLLIDIRPISIPGKDAGILADKSYMAATATRTSRPRTFPYAIVSEAYEATLRNLGDARHHLKKDQPRQASVELQKAQIMILQLMSYHDPVLGGDIADDLLRLYSYTLSQVIDARSNRDVEAIDRAAHVLIALQDGLNIYTANAA